MSKYLSWAEKGIHYILSIDGTVYGQGNSLEEALTDAYNINGIKKEEVAL